ncbi:MAG: hypothetical protein Aurels2KO_47290 [Aureliella sp.]
MIKLATNMLLLFAVCLAAALLQQLAIALEPQDSSNSKTPPRAASVASIVWSPREPDVSLPRGVVQRLGPTEFRRSRIYARKLSFFADNRTLLSFGGGSDEYLMTDALTGHVTGQIKTSDPGLQLVSVGTSANGRFVVASARENRPGFGERPYYLRIFRTADRTAIASLAWKSDLRSSRPSIAVSNDGRLAALAGPGKLIQVWDVGDASPHAISTDASEIVDVEFSHDGETLIARSRDAAFLWDLKANELVAKLDFERIQGIAVSDQGYLAVSDDDFREVSVWNIHDGKRICRIRSPHLARSTHNVGLAFIPRTSRLIVSYPQAEALEIWDAEAGARVSSKEGLSSAPSVVAVSPDGTLLGGAGRNCRVDVWKVKGLAGIATKFVGHADEPRALQFSSDGKRAFSSSRHGELCTWDIASSLPLQLLRASDQRGPRGSFTALDISPSGEHALALGFRARLHLWDLTSGDLKYHLSKHGKTGRVGSHACTFSASGQQFCSFGPEYYFRRWDTETGKCLMETRPYPGDPVELDEEGNLPSANDVFAPFGGFGGRNGPPSLQISKFSADGSKLIYLADKVYVVDTRTGKIMDSLQIDRSDDMAITADASKVATSGGNAVMVYQFDNSQPPLKLDTQSGARVKSFSRDGKMVSVVEHPSTPMHRSKWMSIFDTRSGKKLFHIQLGLNAGTTSEFLPDGKQVAVSQGDSTILIYALSHFVAD